MVSMEPVGPLGILSGCRQLPPSVLDGYVSILGTTSNTLPALPSRGRGVTHQDATNRPASMSRCISTTRSPGSPIRCFPKIVPSSSRSSIRTHQLSAGGRVARRLWRRERGRGGRDHWRRSDYNVRRTREAVATAYSPSETETALRPHETGQPGTATSSSRAGPPLSTGQRNGGAEMWRQ